MTLAAPRGMPHPQSEFAKRIDHLAAVEPLSVTLQEQLAVVARARGQALVNDRRADLSFVKFAPGGVNIYDGTVGHGRYVVKATTVVRGSVVDLLAQLRHRSTSTHDCRRSMHAFFLRSFCHSINLDQVDNPNNDGLNVHWLALRGDGTAPSPLDVVFASHTQHYVWARSQWRPSCPNDFGLGLKEAGTHIWESIDTRATPPFDGSSTGCTRLQVHHSGFVVESSDELANHCNVSFVLCFHQHVSPEWMHDLVGGFANVLRHDSFRLVPSQLWSYAAHCYLCFKTFRLYRRRHHCRLCGNAICSRCSYTTDLDVPSLLDDAVVERAKSLACHKCNIHYKSCQRINGFHTTSAVLHQSAMSTTSSDDLSNTASCPPPAVNPRRPSISWRRRGNNASYMSAIPPQRPPPMLIDDMESTFTIHVPRRSMSIPQDRNVAVDDGPSEVEFDALYTIHDPMAVLRPQSQSAPPPLTGERTSLVYLQLLKDELIPPPRMSMTMSQYARDLDSKPNNRASKYPQSSVVDREVFCLVK
ncbi:Aste57867_24403 [Aphanomyces stellatus]|uniref:Aste57867_24403 protein n=1 Tax=Aphanomyces stellatus TaxID=120398 RepID=A0A485LR25_9STRA|nr:hypothetical protein As57867_024327 [Aphanomyces stellatus]VFU01043.1 Aste57867_24403 [Aphanomyces stellatus]